MEPDEHRPPTIRHTAFWCEHTELKIPQVLVADGTDIDHSLPTERQWRRFVSGPRIPWFCLGRDYVLQMLVVEGGILRV